ncbi:hypothetical protein kpssk3_003 [Klebsiella phage kpssk3]|uniref:Uncharacterized protein n=1 Tax=Klebsiella phage kpssk3 TaxID=2488949 RepID=A0A3G8F356_9CAUD|nr:hypothetical protein HOU69_gp03 [Klebsiella phage kpssk3]AZF88808.1 hypothetical protein kpssk3_003 [Klebsiella phage kpssk3]
MAALRQTKWGYSMSQRTDLKKAFKIARMVMAYGSGEKRTRRILAARAGRLPARQRKWVMQQVYTELYHPERIPEGYIRSPVGWKRVATN